tara:strand:+ start:1025 stop:2908 length:1884 start_codon:yes stop_codon:yes gene_type:complete
MAAANSTIRVTDLNFNTIKSNLKTFLRGKPQFTDYDFEGSALSNLIDLLAYNTYYNAVYTNMVGNEMFLDSAQIRNNVVARAKMLGYTPTSARGSSAVLDVTITPSTNVTSVTIAANTLFTSTIDGIQYKFTTPESYVLLQSTGYTSNTVVIKEGEPLQERFVRDTSSSSQRFILSNPSIDTTSIKVQIQTGGSNTSLRTFTEASNIVDVQANTQVYFVQENEDGKYELLFGDNVLGKALDDGNIVVANYRVVNGSTTNGANNFVAPAALGGQASFTVAVANSASGGANSESVPSIKFNAPKSFQRQNRAVIKNDYSRTILAEAPDIQAVSVWGGEDNDPPIYGKVYIAAKPTGGNLLSDQRKAELVTLLQSKNVVTIAPTFVDATFLYVVPTITTRYNVAQTSKTASAISDLVAAQVLEYETTDLSLFDRKFRESDFLAKVTSSDTSIVGANITYRMMKRFTPNQNVTTSYSVAFNNGISNPHAGHYGAVASTSFTFQNQTCFLDDDGNGILRIYYLDSQNNKTYLNTSAGTVNYSSGLVVIKSVVITSSDTIEVSCKPAINDVSPARNMILLISKAAIDVVNDSTGAVESSVSNVTTAGTTETITSETSSILSTGSTGGVTNLVY